VPLNQEFKQCLENGKIIPFPKGNLLVNKELSVAESDLLDAKAGYESKRYKWSIIQAYYAMFHAARALLYSRGYREKSHYCLSIAMKSLFIEEGKLDSQTGRDFLNAMNLRQAADYEAEFSMDGARAVIESATKFIEKAKEILSPKN
jgi:uncharacterized protein (UPF0332 family)